MASNDLSAGRIRKNKQRTHNGEKITAMKPI
jgi:hypothetical protein